MNKKTLGFSFVWAIEEHQRHKRSFQLYIVGKSLTVVYYFKFKDMISGEIKSKRAIMNLISFCELTVYLDNDEPLLSGSGDVSKECAEKILETWGDLLSKW